MTKITRPRTKRKVLYALSGFAVIATAATAAYAALPTQSYDYWTASVDVDSCGYFLERAIEEATGNSATVTVQDSQNIRVRGYNSDARVFGYCSQVSSTICGVKKSRVNIVAFGENGSSDASALRDLVRYRFGDPTLSCP